MCRSHHLVHCSHRVYKHDILMRRTGLVVFPFGCGLSCWAVSGVFCRLAGPRPAAAAGTGCAAAALANWPSLVWRLGDAAAPPAPLPDARPAILPAQLLILSMPRPELPYAVPYTVPSAQAPGHVAPCPAAIAPAAGNAGGRGRWQHRPAGQQPNCGWRWHSAISVRLGLFS